ncbi:hypothetical protein GGI11_001319 [Coemansia sp. RSA 2049]|nr:hypothetical protein H4217_006445 [Coemansia sp. RSA 1939]KAJ2523712.1 hypothetical protein GGI11_001319 [Coemansia sp. RSA 2049]KAJ2607998.1 hypothetical protein EV177_005211 [Coemansia sp. RSA 1804]KAJ2691862.1 hypothetical protein GGH99_002114 [Coemansia sp. RSA 1285]
MKAASNKCMLFVSGLETEVTEDTLHGAFIPFGEIVQITLPPDPGSSNRHRGIGFIEYEDEEDAAAAIDNMNDAELFGRTITVRTAKAAPGSAGAGAVMGKIFNQESWLEKNMAGDNNSGSNAGNLETAGGESADGSDNKS